VSWLKEANVFCNTLVDRIVPGFPFDTAKEIEAKLGYEDQQIVEGEPFHLWVIEGPEWIKNEIPAQKADLNVLFVNDMTPYRTRKVRILNGAHTVMTPVAYLSGIETVREAMEHPLVGEYINQVLHEEIIPTLDLSREELVNFAESVNERFRNPHVKHALMSISLNSISKFKARVLPSLIEFQKINGEVPERISLSMAAMFAFYRGKIGNKIIAVKDDENIIALFNSLWNNFDNKKINEMQLVTAVLKDKTIWDIDLTTVPGLVDTTSEYLKDILQYGMLEVLNQLMSSKAIVK
jgi:tagaturonate reductase